MKLSMFRVALVLIIALAIVIVEAYAHQQYKNFTKKHSSDGIELPTYSPDTDWVEKKIEKFEKNEYHIKTNIKPKK